MQLANVTQELDRRGIKDYPKWAPRAALVAILEAHIEEEERTEVCTRARCAACYRRPAAPVSSESVLELTLHARVVGISLLSCTENGNSARTAVGRVEA
jgi:hypothetical protein